MRALALCLLIAGPALADGVPLILPQLMAAEQASAVTEGRPARSITGVQINRGALESNVITIDIADKTYRFVGSMRHRGEDGGDFWFGSAPEGDAELMRNKTGFFGMVTLYPNTMQMRVFHLTNGALVEFEPRASKFEDTPEMAENRAKRVQK